MGSANGYGHWERPVIIVMGSSVLSQLLKLVRVLRSAFDIRLPTQSE